jgi:hypothetical protein
MITMPVCPLCLFDNPAGVAACEHCGRHRFSVHDLAAHAGSATPEAATVQGTQWKNAIAQFGKPETLSPPPETQQGPVQLSQSSQAPSPRLVVVRGQKLNVEFPLYDGDNVLGRTADRPADIDLTGLEPPEQIWSSRSHAVIRKEKDQFSIEDLNSLNGTYLNRQKLHPGRKFVLKENDVIQIGTVQLRLML